MNKDQMKGRVARAKGKVKEAIAGLTGDKHLKTQGQAEQLEGQARATAGDATALNARPRAGAKAVAAEAGQGLPQPSGGRKEYTDEQGRVVKVVEWFGYKLHLLADARHEVKPGLSDHRHPRRRQRGGRAAGGAGPGQPARGADQDAGL